MQKKFTFFLFCYSLNLFSQELFLMETSKSGVKNEDKKIIVSLLKHTCIGATSTIRIG